MEKITFSTVLGTAVTIDDVNTSSDADGYIPLHLLSFEGNALGYKHDSSERVGFDGAGFYGAKKISVLSPQKSLCFLAAESRLRCTSFAESSCGTFPPVLKVR